MSTYEEDVLARLADSLVTRTRARGIRWDDAPRDAFIAPFEAGSVVVRSRDRDGTWPFEMELLDKNGRVIATRGTVFESEDYSITDEQRAWNALVAALYTNARAAALDIDATVDALLKQIEHGEQPEPVESVEPPAREDDIPS